ncbi:hypothetical protein AMTRI_Chr07g26000 [Amborella trichopoda]
MPTFHSIFTNFLLSSKPRFSTAKTLTNLSTISTSDSSFPISSDHRSWNQAKEALGALILSPSCSPSQLLQIHGQVIATGFSQNIFLNTLLVSKYHSFQDPEAAHLVFNSVISKPNSIFWNSMIRGCCINGRLEEMIDIYSEMMNSGVSPDKLTYNLVLKACTDLSDFEYGLRIHDQIVQRSSECEVDVLVGTSLINMYSKFGDVCFARSLFDRMPLRDIVAWNVMISGYSRNGLLSESLYLFKYLRLIKEISPNESTLVSIISVCRDLVQLQLGEAVHGFSIKTGLLQIISVSNSLIDMYISCGCLDVSAKLFDQLTVRDSVAWSLMIGGYSAYGRGQNAMKLFRVMKVSKEMVPTRAVLLNLLPACADLGAWEEAEKSVEEYTMNSLTESDASLSTALLNVYLKCGKIDKAFKLFGERSQRDTISWNAMIRGLGELKLWHQALRLFIEMWQEGREPDLITMLIVLPLIGSIASLKRAKEAHAYVIKTNLLLEIRIANSLIDMYSKCGCIKISQIIFDSILEKDVISWSSMISGYAMNGCSEDAIELFHAMEKTCTKPNNVTFVSLLSACTRGGLVEKGKEYFKSMRDVHGIKPEARHYACMVDLLSRAGFISQARELMDFMGTELSTSGWGSLLSACRVQCESLQIGEEAAKHLFNLEPRNAANYLVLASMYNSMGRSDDAKGVLRLLKERRVKKISPGCSWVC